MRIWLVVLVGCYAPSLHPGQPCGEGEPCPIGLQCSPATSTCELSASDIDASVFDAADAQILIDGCTPAMEICGDGIDQDCDGHDTPCAANDLPSGAIDVTAGGNFVANLIDAHDDSSRPVQGGGPTCGGTGGHDVFYKVHLTTPEVFYFDTFGSDFDTVLRSYPGACMAGAAPMGSHCSNDACTTMQTQTAFSLGSGDTCIVIDQYSGSETNGSLHLHVERGHRDGSRIFTGTHTVSSDTTGSTDMSTGTCASQGNDDGYYFVLCPGDNLTLSATTCNETTTWDTALYAEGPAGQLACNDDDDGCAAPVAAPNVYASTISTPVAGAHLFWVIVDAGDPGVAGAYELDTTIQ